MEQRRCSREDKNLSFLSFTAVRAVVMVNVNDTANFSFG